MQKAARTDAEDRLLKCMGVKPSAEIVALMRFADQTAAPPEQSGINVVTIDNANAAKYHQPK